MVKARIIYLEFKHHFTIQMAGVSRNTFLHFFQPMFIVYIVGGPLVLVEVAGL